jgi:hypothetical protein
MKQEIQNLITELYQDNEDRTAKMNNPQVTNYGWTVHTHEYNAVLGIIKKLETIIK